MVITWSTMNDVGSDGSIVEYGINGFALTACGTTEKFVDDGPAKHTQYIHRVRFQFVFFFRTKSSLEFMIMKHLFFRFHCEI